MLGLYYSDLIVLGAGPKGVSIAAKRWALRKVGIAVPVIDILEKSTVGAHWEGGNGYTDGAEFLVTPPEQDIGFPYFSIDWSPEELTWLNDEMAKLSLQSFLLRNKEYGNWIIQGRNLSHTRFTSYLRWVAGLVGLQTTPFDVQIINSVFSKEWLLTDKEGNHAQSRGLVITGNGPARLLKDCPASDFILDGKNFWENLSKMTQDSTVAVVGAGETAGTIAAAVARRIANRANTIAKIFLIHNQPAYYSRGQAWGEQRWFIDPDGALPEGPAERTSPTTPWSRLSNVHRREIIM